MEMIILVGMLVVAFGILKVDLDNTNRKRKQQSDEFLATHPEVAKMYQSNNND